MITGLIMLFYIEKPIKFTHEIAGIAFTIAIILHAISNIKSIKRYLSQVGATSIIVVAWIIGISLIATSLLLDRGEIEYTILEKLKKSSVESLAGALNLTPEYLVNQLENNGVKVENSKITIEELATQANVESDDIIEYIFR